AVTELAELPNRRGEVKFGPVWSAGAYGQHAEPLQCVAQGPMVADGFEQRPAVLGELGRLVELSVGQGDHGEVAGYPRLRQRFGQVAEAVETARVAFSGFADQVAVGERVAEAAVRVRSGVAVGGGTKRQFGHPAPGWRAAPHLQVTGERLDQFPPRVGQL